MNRSTSVSRLSLTSTGSPAQPRSPASPIDCIRRNTSSGLAPPPGERRRNEIVCRSTQCASFTASLCAVVIDALRGDAARNSWRAPRFFNKKSSTSAFVRSATWSFRHAIPTHTCDEK